MKLIKNKSILFFLILLPQMLPGQNYGSFTDPRDNQTYKTININGKTWLAQNLNFETGVSWCYNDVPYQCNVYGRLYDWETAKTACPPGWRLPSEEDWYDLMLFAGGLQEGGANLKSKEKKYWDNEVYMGTNKIGFSAIPSGIKTIGISSDFAQQGFAAMWWSSTQDNETNAWSWSVYDLGKRLKWESHNINKGMSCRCVKN